MKVGRRIVGDIRTLLLSLIRFPFSCLFPLAAQACLSAPNPAYRFMLRFTILGSGSSGNCAYLETDDVRLLVDAGFSAKQIERRLQAIGRSLAEVQAIFLTHEHGDHVCGLPVVAKRHNIPIYCNRLTAECLHPQMPEFTKWRLFESGATMELGDLTINSFSVPHDAYDPVGFLFDHALGKIGFLTDLGYATQLVIERVRAARALVLEANHDLQLLQDDTRRPWPVKQRILSRHGHLSNDAAAAVAAEVVTDGMEDLYLGHLSSDCNSPDHARRTVARRLEETGHTFTRLHDTAPDRPSTTLVWR